MTLIEEIQAANSLEELTDVVASRPEGDVREQLHDAFFRLVEYRNAADWNRLVRVCEALEIIGWGEVEPLDARADRWINGRLYTDLRNRQFENRFLSAGWSQRGDTYILDASHRYFYASPDRPESAELDTQAYAAAHPEVDETDYGVTELRSQRNLLARNPLRVQVSGNRFDKFIPFIDELLVLKRRLDRETRPELYGRDFDYVGITYQFSNVWGVYFHGEIPAAAFERFEKSKIGHFRPFDRPRFDIGRMSTKSGQTRLVVDRYVPESFVDPPLDDQKRMFVDDVREVLDVLEARLAKRNASYDVLALRDDFERICADWLGPDEPIESGA